MDIVPVNNVSIIIDPARRDSREQPQRRQQPRKRERITPVPVYTPNGGIEEQQPPKIDVLV